MSGLDRLREVPRARQQPKLVPLSIGQLELLAGGFKDDLDHISILEYATTSPTTSTIPATMPMARPMQKLTVSDFRLTE